MFESIRKNTKPLHQMLPPLTHEPTTVEQRQIRNRTLKESEWSLLEEMVPILQFIESVTKVFEVEKTPTFGMVMPSFCWMKEGLEKMKLTHPVVEAVHKEVVVQFYSTTRKKFFQKIREGVLGG